MADKHSTPGGGKKHRRKNEAPGWRKRLLRTLSEWGIAGYIWLLRLTCRIRVVDGGEHVDTALAAGTPVIPCGWHQRLVPSGLFLRSLVPRGMNIGFLISPSREGEFMSRVAHAHRVK